MALCHINSYRTRTAAQCIKVVQIQVKGFSFCSYQTSECVCDLSNFDPGRVVDTRQASSSISETADLLGSPVLFELQ